jgi:pimeloyl-ACP methyl ester carboxylesterase
VDAVEERVATLRSGVRLPYAETGRPGVSIPVVFVHAYVESWRYFEPVMRCLPPSIHTFAPTQRGHQSVEGNPVGFRISDFASDIVDFMDAVGAASSVLVGASSGGLVSQVVATRHPQRVAGLVLVSSPVTLAGKPGVTALREEIMALSDPIDPRFVEQFVRGTSPNEMSGELVARLVDQSLAIPAQVWRESFLGLLEADRAEALENIHVPTLLLSGSVDAFVRDDQQVLLDSIPNAELVVYDGVGHGPHLAHPERVATDLAEFVHRHRVRAGQSSNPATTP